MPPSVSYPMPLPLRTTLYFFAVAALARSARASRRLNLASWITPNSVSITCIAPISRSTLPASASLEKFPVHSMKVLPSWSPEVIGKSLTVLRTLVYVSSGDEVMTLYVME